jgi:hypothetical protein
MRSFCPNAEIHCIEDQFKWYIRWKILNIAKIHYLSLKDGSYYFPTFPEQYFDFIFIDAPMEYEKRQLCLESAYFLVKDDGHVMLHDANHVIKTDKDTVILRKNRIKSGIGKVGLSRSDITDF